MAKGEKEGEKGEGVEQVVRGGLLGREVDEGLRNAVGPRGDVIGGRVGEGEGVGVGVGVGVGGGVGGEKIGIVCAKSEGGGVGGCWWLWLWWVRWWGVVGIDWAKSGGGWVGGSCEEVGWGGKGGG